MLSVAEKVKRKSKNAILSVMKHVQVIFFSWFPLAGATTGILLVCYAGIQQNYRQSLNDPQIQMAEDAADAIDSGVPINQIVPIGSVGSINILTSLAPWMGVYDASGKVLVSSGTLVGEIPQPPKGVFDDTRSGLPSIVGHHLTLNIPTNENRVSWQPNPILRQAIVVVYVPRTNQFVVVGRNMREVENRIGNLSTMFFLGWLALMAATLSAKGIEWYFNGARS